MEILIGDRLISESSPAFIIAEIGQAHDGSLGTAHAYIDAVARTGVDAVKFQTHIAVAESSKEERFRVNFSYQDETRFDYWRRMEFTPDQWAGLAAHARDRGLVFLSSPFSAEAVDLLDRLGCPAWKVGSGETSNFPLLAKMVKTGKPMLISSGMSSWQELDKVAAYLNAQHSSFAIFQCTTSYPCPPEQWGLNIIPAIARRYKCLSGYSDHSGNIAAGMAAVTLGAKFVEVHVTFSRDCFGPDVSSSLTIQQLTELSNGIRVIECAIRNPVDKSFLSEELRDLKILFAKSIYAARDLTRGTRLALDDFAYKKPGNGIPAADAFTLVGKELYEDIPANTLLNYKHIR